MTLKDSLGIFLAEASFSAYVFAFLKGKKQHILASLRQNMGKGKEHKGRPKLVVLFLVEKCTFSPALNKTFA